MSDKLDDSGFPTGVPLPTFSRKLPEGSFPDRNPDPVIALLKQLLWLPITQEEVQTLYRADKTFELTADSLPTPLPPPLNSDPVLSHRNKFKPHMLLKFF